MNITLLLSRNRAIVRNKYTALLLSKSISLCHNRPNNPKSKSDRDCLIQTLKDCNKENLFEESVIIIPTTALRMLESVLKKPFSFLPILNLAIILEILIQFVLKTSYEWDQTTSLGNPSQCLTPFSPSNYFLICSLKPQKVAGIRTENKGANEIKKLYRFIPKNYINTW